MIGITVAVLYLLASLKDHLSLAEEFKPEDFQEFKTEPTFRANRIKVVDAVNDATRLAPGYIFFAPFARDGQPLVGPQIIDSAGELVWYGNSSTTGRVQNFQVCDYLGEHGNHLCYSEGEDVKITRGTKGSQRIFDNTYTQVGRDWGSVGHMRYPNPHEFYIVPGGRTFLQTIWPLARADLSSRGGPVDGVVEDGCFQEVDIATGRSLFDWCALDHGVSLNDSKVNLKLLTNEGEPDRFGAGTATDPWDYLHLNSVEKNSVGDYIVSARHLDTVIKVAGLKSPSGLKPGTIIWRLGGDYNDIQRAHLLDNSRQHHVRIINETASTTSYSMFNNQQDASEHNRHISNGQIFTLDENTKTVLSVQKYYEPEGWFSRAQGSMQHLPNGNVLIGWGLVPHASEFTADGELLQHTHLADYLDTGNLEEDFQNYRVFKFPWVGKPKSSPKMLAYTANCTRSSKDEKPLLAYVSWNGATEVRSWRFHTSRFSKHGPWIRAGTFPRSGFETKVELQDAFGQAASFRRFVSVEALDGRENVIGRVISKTFVPSEEMAEKCDDDGCFEPTRFEYDLAWSCSDKCAGDSTGFSVVLWMTVFLAVIAVVFNLSRCRRKRRWIDDAEALIKETKGMR